MVNEQLPVACRYVPYDQWFITHISPTWKIRHLKQRIISKCLNLPFDPRFIQKDVTNARSPSPITFAPDASIKQESPIEFAGVGDDQESTGGGGGGGGDEGYEEDDEWEQEFDVVGTKSKVKSKSSSPFTPSSSFHVRLQQQKQEKEPQITTHTYTLLRFSTSQVLEEDYQISWYDIQPHELVELHPSFSPPTFASSVVSPMSVPSPPPTMTALPQTKSSQKKKKPSSTTTTHQGDLPIPSLTVLPRHAPNLYIQPYWQGWVRSLRAVWRIQTSPASYESSSVEDYGNADRKCRRHGEKLEWRERWVVIHEGIINICKSPTDQNPTRLPLSSLIALHGPECLHFVRNGTSKSRSKSHTLEPSTTSTMTAGSLRASSYISLGPSATLLKPSDVSDKDPKRSTRNLKKTRKDGLFSTASSPSLRSLGQDRQPHRMSSYTPTLSKPKSTLPLPAEDYDQGGEKALAKRASREKVEREVEFTKKWDDLGFSFTLGGKDKSKNKGKENDKDREADADIHRISQNKEILHSKSLKDKDKTFIPTSREEAEQAGMKIICVKFRPQPAAKGERDKVIGQDGAFPKARRYTSTGPSLALVATPASGAGKVRTRMKTSTTPHVVIGSDVYVGDSSFEDFAGRYQPQPQQGILTGSNRSSTPGTDSMTTSPISSSHPTGFTWNLLGGIKEKEDFVDKMTERRKITHDNSRLSPPPSTTGAAEDVEVTRIVNSSSWKSLHAQKLEKGAVARSQSTGIGSEGDEDGYAGTIASPSASSFPMIVRPTVVIPNSSPVLASTITTVVTSVSPESQPDNQTPDNPNSDSSSISISSPVFAHSIHESDLEDETFYRPLSGAASGMSGASGTNRPRKGYRYGGYHFQPQMKKMKSEGEDERLVDGDSRGTKRAAEMEVEGRLGDGDQPQTQQARREGKESNKNEEREGWITLDMVNDNAFNSILRILHRHSPPSLSSSFTHSPGFIDLPNIPNTSKLNSAKDHYDSQGVPSDTDDGSQYAAMCNPSATRNRAIHPPILESLSSRAAINLSDQKPLYVALPYPEWRLEVVNQARRAGMREIGRPLDLALHGWGREFDEMAVAARERKLERERELEKEKKKRRRSVQSHVSTIKQRERRISSVVGGSDADDDDDDDGDEEGTMGETQLDSDSEEESDTEWLAWMTDLPRQFLVQQQSELAFQNSQAFFSNPFLSSSLTEGDDDGPVRLPRTQEEERILYANKMRKLEPSAISTVTHPSHLPSPTTSNSFIDSLKQFPSLSSHSSFDSLNHQRGLSSRNSTPFPGFSSVDDLLVNKDSHSRAQSRSLQHLGAHRNVGSVPEECGDQATASSPPRHGLHHSASMDQHLSSRKNEVDSHHSIASQKQKQSVLGKPILTSEQIKQIESEVFSSSPLPSHWTFPPIPMPSSPSMASHTPSASTPTPTPTPTPTARPAVVSPSLALVSANPSEEVKALSSISAINRFTSSDFTRWSRSFGNSLSTPPSPSASATVSPNSISPPRSTVFGSLGRSPSLLSKVGGQEKEKKGFLLKKRMSRDLGKDKERESESAAAAAASPKQRPKLLLSGLSSSTSTFSPAPMPLQNHPETSSQAHNPISSSARALLRRVRSGSSLRGEESSTASPACLGAVSPEVEGREVQKKKKGPIDRIVRGFDSSLAFAEGR